MKWNTPAVVELDVRMTENGGAQLPIEAEYAGDCKCGHALS